MRNMLFIKSYCHRYKFVNLKRLEKSLYEMSQLNILIKRYPTFAEHKTVPMIANSDILFVIKHHSRL